MKFMIPPGEDIISTLTEHYGKRIHNAQRFQSVMAIKEFAALLQREDTEERNVEIRNRNNNNPNPRTYGYSIPQSPPFKKNRTYS